MVKAWYKNDTTEDDRLPHYQQEPPTFLDLDTVHKRTGIRVWQVSCFTSDLTVINKFSLDRRGQLRAGR